VIRFKSLERRISFRDEIRGEMTFPPDHVDDFIIIKTDGTPSYNFAAVIDDLLMDITHVIRGSDHLSNTPKQIMLFVAMGREAPVYAHHSLLIGADRKPLSKRHGATRVAEFRGMGILPEALLNYLAIIGRKVDKEVQDRPELLDSFSLRRLSASDSVFDLEKLLWLNKEYLRKMDAGCLLDRLELPSDFRERVALLRENAATLNEIRSHLKIFDEVAVEEDALAYLAAIHCAQNTISRLKQIFDRDGKDFDEIFNSFKTESPFPRKEQMMLLRIAITGRKSGPPLKEVYRLIPKHIILSRIEWLAKNLYDSSSA
jgi:glutamyl/glutaminyl-tRNA synthetase